LQIWQLEEQRCHEAQELQVLPLLPLLVQYPQFQQVILKNGMEHRHQL
jgi:hypothetical protein